MNIKLVVIEDEILVRKGIISSIDWNKYGIQVVGEAADGLSGLELIRKVRPDIILTDIMMPHLNGLEMIKIIRNELPKAKILILSVMEDFQMVREALRYEVIDYIPKLKMTPEELLETVLKIKRTIFGQIDVNQLSNNEVFTNEYELWTWLKGNPSPIFDTHIISNTAYIVGKIHIKLNENEDHLIVNKKIDRLKYLIKQTEDPFIRNAYVGRNNDNQLIMLIVGSQEQLQIQNVIKILNGILILLQSDQIYITVGLSKVSLDSSNRVNFLLQAESALNRRFFRGVGIYSFQEETLEPKIIDFFNTDLLKNYIESIHNGNEELSLQLFEQLFPRELIGNVSPSVVRQEMYQWVSAIIIRLKECEIKLQESLIELSPYEQIQKLDTYEDLRIWSLSFHNKIQEQFTTLRSCLHRSEIQEAIEYTHKNYMDNIKVKKIADKVNLSENYFSYLFSKETGKTFSQFLQEIRVEKAKKFLPQGSRDWIAVGEQVGFESPKYFTKVFKKHTGFTPKQYLKNQRNRKSN